MKAFSIFAAISSAAHLASAQTRYETNCTIFNWNREPAYLVNDTRVSRVSAAQTCPSLGNSSHACPIVIQGDSQVLYRANLSNTVLGNVINSASSSGPTNYYVDLVNRTIGNAVNTSIGVPFREAVIGLVDAVFPQPAGTSGYVNFYPTLQCYEGTLSNCSANTLPENTAVEFCAPVYSTSREEGGSMAILDGDYVYVEIPEANVSQFGDPFGSQVRGTAASIGVNIGLAIVLSAVSVALMFF